MDLLSKAKQLVSESEALLESGTTRGQLRRQLFGKGGNFASLLQQIGQLPPDERPKSQVGLQLIKAQLELLLSDSSEVTQIEHSPKLDRTVPPVLPQVGSIHPISQMIEQMTDIFSHLGFEVIEGPEIVGEAENFDWLNMSPDHPARDGHDSFFLNNKQLLRTQTTAVQVLEMRKRLQQNKLPMRIVVPGKTYRRESDPTHSTMFHQIDAVLVDTHTNFADLRGSLDYFVTQLFGEEVETRFRPHHFPFTEPSAELDIRWKQTGKTQESGKHTQWLEMGGCGMIHPAVLKRAGINPELYRGWAFGMSIERPIMVKYGVDDLRRFYENSQSFLAQFPSI